MVHAHWLAIQLARDVIDGDFCTRVGNEQLNKWYDEANT